MSIAHSARLNSALETHRLVHAPLVSILRRLLAGLEPALLAEPDRQTRLVAQADLLLVAESPAAALIPLEVRQAIIRRVLDEILEAVLTPAAVAGAAAAGAATGAGEPPEIPVGPGALRLGVRGIVIQAAAGSDEETVRAAVAHAAPGWRFAAMEGLPGFYTARPDSVQSITVRAAWDLAQALMTAPGIAHAEPAIRQLPENSGPATAAFLSTFGSQDHNVGETKTTPDWSVDKTHARDAWNSGRKGEGILIGHIDTGYTRHSEIVGNVDIARGYDTWDGDPDAEDDLDPSLWDRLRATFPVLNPGHGTGTGSVIASPEGPQPGHAGAHGITGTAPRATIIPIRATPTVVILPTGSADEVAEGILKATSRGAKVISMSIGSPWPSRDLGAAINRALDAGVIVCAAAGNVVLAESWLTGVTYPAAYPGVVAVAGCDYHYRPWRDSCRGPEVVVTAPGTDVWRARASRARGPVIDYTTGQGSGTSFAVATIAGIAACWLNHWGGWAALVQRLGNDPRQVPEAFRDCLRRHTATPLNIPTTPPPDLPNYPRFHPADFGVGVIHAGNLLLVQPQIVPIMAAAIAVLPDGDETVALIRAALLPDRDRHTIQRALALDLGVAPDALPAFLRAHGRELLHHVATSADVRARLRAVTNSLLPLTAAAAAAPMPGEPLAVQLSLRGSASFTADLP